MKIKSILFLLSSAFLVQAGFVQSNQDDPNACYESKDKECLEAMYKDIVTNPAPEKSDAIYLLGLLYLEEENYEAAKDQFEMGIMFGDQERNAEKFSELVKSGHVEIRAFDCFAIGTEQCFLDVAEKNPEKAGVAYYHLSSMLSKTDATRATEYTIKAAELGHVTSACLLAFGYGHYKASGPSVTAGFVPELPKDYEKARLWGEECGSGPFPGYSKKHFTKYEAAKGHKAYAIFGTKYRIYEQGAATPEIASVMASKLCEFRTKDRSEDEECLIVNIDGEWVDHFAAESLPERAGAVDDLLQMEARESYEKYLIHSGPNKVFVQGPLGNWSWRSRAADVSIEEVTRQAVESCQKSWRYTSYGSACEAVNVNGEWLK